MERGSKSAAAAAASASAAESSYDNPISSYDAPLTIEKSYTAPVSAFTLLREFSVMINQF